MVSSKHEQRYSTASLNIDIIFLKLNVLKVTLFYCKQPLRLMKAAQKNVLSEEVARISGFSGFN